MESWRLHHSCQQITPCQEGAILYQFSILSECCHKKATNTGLSGQVICRTQWGEQPATEDVFEIFANGAKRDVFCTQLQNFIVKAELCDSSGKNRNKEEWETYSSVPSFRAILPQVLGYFECEFGQKRLALLLVERIGVSFAHMLVQMQCNAVSAGSLGTVCQCTLRVVRQMRDIVAKDIRLYDWHIGNIGFMDIEGAPGKLLDWEKNRPASAMESYRDRMSRAFFRITFFGSSRAILF